MPEVKLHLGDCLDVMQGMPDASIDACVCDPPYGLKFMGRRWDYDVPGENIWREVYRVMKGGSVLLAFGGTRTYHRMVCPIEDAGFQIEDSIHWVHGQGFPKHKSKLKPAHEPIVLARKPGPKWLGVERTRIGTGAGGTRDGEATAEARYADRGSSNFAAKPGPRGGSAAGRWPANLVLSHSPGCVRRGTKRVRGTNVPGSGGTTGQRQSGFAMGPDDINHYADPDGLETVADYVCVEGCPIRLMGEQGGESVSRIRKTNNTAPSPTFDQARGRGTEHADSGTAARFFPNFDAEPYDPFCYCPKASRKDRNAGCEGMEAKASGVMQDDAYRWEYDGKGNKIDLATRNANHHPTVKPNMLMRWLCRLSCPPGGVILDPFAGSGSTGRAAVQEGFGFVGVEREEEYFKIAQARIADAQASLESSLFA